MATQFFNLYTSEYLTVNDVRVNIYNSATDALITGQQYPGNGTTFPIRTWSFPGLISVNYRILILEMIGSTVVQQLGDMDAIPKSGFNQHAPIQWKSGDPIPGGVGNFPSGVTSITIPDAIGWEVDHFSQFANEYKRGVDYSWNKNTGTLSKLQDGDIFEPNVFYGLWFQPQEDYGGGVSPGEGGGDGLFTAKKVITNTETLLSTDFGKKILLKGTQPYYEVTLPYISTLPELSLAWVEMERSDTPRCIKINTFAGDIINWREDNLDHIYICPSESFEIYSEVDDSDPDNIQTFWRIQNACGNFMCVGCTVGSYMIPSKMFNKVPKDGGGAGLSVDAYARIYNDFVMNLDGAQKCAFAQWDFQTALNGVTYFPNKGKYSLANDAGLFHVPDTRNMFKRQTGSRQAGSFEQTKLQDHTHGTIAFTDNPSNLGTVLLNKNIGKYTGTIAANAGNQGDLTTKPYIINPLTNLPYPQAISSETVPVNIADNEYIFV